MVGGEGTLGELVGQAAMALALDGNAAHVAKEDTEGPEEPFLLHQEIGVAPDSTVIELGEDEVEVARVGSNTEDALILMGNTYIYLPTEEAAENEAAQGMRHIFIGVASIYYRSGKERQGAASIYYRSGKEWQVYIIGAARSDT